MKKTYKNPTLTVVNVQTAQFIAASQEDVQVGTTYSGTKVLGRKGSFSGWNEDSNDE